MNKEFNLSEMIVQNVFINVEDVKEKIQNAQNRLKVACEGLPTIRYWIDEIFKEEFGDKLTGEQDEN